MEKERRRGGRERQREEREGREGREGRAVVPEESGGGRCGGGGRGERCGEGVWMEGKEKCSEAVLL